MVESLVSVLAFCDPIAAQWDKSLLKTAKCWPPHIFNVFPIFNTCMFPHSSVSEPGLRPRWQLKLGTLTRGT